MIRHKKVKGICYLTEITEKHLGRCEEHNDGAPAPRKRQQQQQRRRAVPTGKQV